MNHESGPWDQFVWVYCSLLTEKLREVVETVPPEHEFLDRDIRVSSLCTRKPVSYNITLDWFGVVIR